MPSLLGWIVDETVDRIRKILVPQFDSLHQRLTQMDQRINDAVANETAEITTIVLGELQKLRDQLASGNTTVDEAVAAIGGMSDNLQAAIAAANPSSEPTG
jgi:hypothetical protein